MQTLAPTTPKQRQILNTILHFRFLSRSQIQNFLHHKDKKTIQTWLNDLVSKKYLHQKPSNHHQSAIYYLSTKGIRLLNTKTNIDLNYTRTLYRNDERTDTFVEHCMLLGGLYLEIVTQNSDKTITWKMYTRVMFPSLLAAEVLMEHKPDAYIERKKPRKTDHYLLHIVKEEPERHRHRSLRKKIKNYFELYYSSEWEDATDALFPKLIFICPNEEIQQYLKRLIKRLMEENDDPEIVFTLSTIEKVKQFGMNGDIWETIK